MKAGHCWILLWACLWSSGDAFNLDVHSYTQHWGTPGSMFGFTVAEHMTSRENLVLVGAPNAQTRQPRVKHGGAVFRCNPLSNDPCVDIVFDGRGNYNDSDSGLQRDEKSGQWFGATLTSTGQNGPVVACAPRYVSFGERRNLRDPVGTCFIGRNDLSEFVEYAPCRTPRSGHNRQGSCQAGFSAAVSQDGKRLFVGAPGSWYWQGQMYSINTTLRVPFMPKEYTDFGGTGQLYAVNTEPAVEPMARFTPESDAFHDDSYLGYSAVVGDFNKMGYQGVAVGMPRGANLYGKVLLYTWDLLNYHNRTGEQLGAYFGYCLAACDVDGDGLDDLIVGAPMYTVPNNEGHYENGRVYVLYQGRGESPYDIIDDLDGEKSKSRFGLSLTSLGDINLDGFGDFAVGAPYEAEGAGTGGGAVYVYHGGAAGVVRVAVQVIRAEQVSDVTNPIKTFGFSLSGGVDLDNNKYTDLVVGAYASDTTIFFRSRPVVKIFANVEVGTSDSKLISLDQRNCTLSERSAHKRVACTSFKYCIQFGGINVDLPIEFNLQFILDSKKSRDPRLFFIDAERKNTQNQTIFLNRDQMECQTVNVYLDNVRDKLTPLEVEMRYSLKEETRTFDYRNSRAPLTPILDMHSGSSRKDSINIQKNCGPDNVCIPDLKLKVTTSMKRYLLGSKDKLWLEAYVHNSGEDAFEATYSLQLPSGVNFVKAEHVNATPAHATVLCSETKQDNNRTFICNIGNPLPKGQHVTFRVLLEADQRLDMASVLEFISRVNSTNPELKIDTADNEQIQKIAVWVETDLVLTGTSVPPDLHYNTTQYKSTNRTTESDIGPQLVHVYSARNTGPSAIEEAQIYLIIPYETLAGDSLLYLLEKPETSENVHCEEAKLINTLGVRIESKSKSYLQSSGVITQGSHQLSWEERQSGVHSQSVSQAQSGGYSQTGSQSQTSGGFRNGGSQSHSGGYSQTGSQSQTGGAFQQGAIHTQSGGYSQTESQSQNRAFQNGGGHTQSGVYSQSGSQSQTGGIQQGRSQTQSGGYSQTGSQSQTGLFHQSVSGSESGGSSQSDRNINKNYQGQVGGGIQSGNERIWNFQQSKNDRPVSSGINKEYVSEWNSTSQYGGAPVVHHTVYNKTTVTDERGVHKTESSTEFYTEGSEGLPGSSFSNSYEQRGRNTGGNLYGNGANTRGSGRQQGSSYEIEGANKHTWSTEETVNKDLANAGSQTYVHNNYNNGGNSQFENGQYENEGRRSRVTGTEKSVRQRQKPTGVGSVAYGVNGEFRTNSLDLGVLGPSGSKEEYSSHGTGSASGYDASSHSSSGSNQYSSGSSHIASGAAGGAQSSSGSYGSMETAGSMGSAGSMGRSTSGSSSYQYGYTKESSAGYGSSAQASSQNNHRSYQSNYGSFPSEPGRDNVETEKPVVANTHFRWDRDTRARDLHFRRRRQAAPQQNLYNEASDKELEKQMQCEGLKCTVVRCVTNRLLKDQEVWIAFRARVDANTLNKLAVEKPVQVSSRMVGRVSRLPYIGVPADAPVRVADAITHVTPQQSGGAGDGVPLWVVVLSACAGAALLLLLIFALYKCGFFKRNRPTDAPERQPLNKNGYGHGDEQL